MMAVIDLIMGSQILMAGIVLFVIAFGLSILSGLIDIAVYLAMLVAAVLLIAGVVNLFIPIFSVGGVSAFVTAGVLVGL